jgi:hypothetical protein
MPSTLRELQTRQVQPAVGQADCQIGNLGVAAAGSALQLPASGAGRGHRGPTSGGPGSDWRRGLRRFPYQLPLWFGFHKCIPCQPQHGPVEGFMEGLGAGVCGAHKLGYTGGSNPDADMDAIGRAARCLL